VQALFDEIGWATEDEPTQDLRDSFKIQRFVVMTRVYSDPEGQDEEAGPSSSKEGGRKKKKAKVRARVCVCVCVCVCVLGGGNGR